MQHPSSRKLRTLDRCRPCRNHRGAPRPVYTTTCTTCKAIGSDDVYYLHTPCQAPNSTCIVNPPPPTTFSFHPEPPCAQPCRHPQAVMCAATATIAVLTIAGLPSRDLATPNLARDRVFNSKSTTSTAELDPIAPAPSCDDRAVVQPWDGKHSHGSLHGSRRTHIHTKVCPHSQHTVGYQSAMASHAQRVCVLAAYRLQYEAGLVVVPPGG